MIGKRMPNYRLKFTSYNISYLCEIIKVLYHHCKEMTLAMEPMVYC